MTKDEAYEACKKYADKYVEKHVVMPTSKAVTDRWDKSDFLRFKTQASKAVSQIELDLKSIAGAVSDKVYEELILSVGGERA